MSAGEWYFLIGALCVIVQVARDKVHDDAFTCLIIWLMWPLLLLDNLLDTLAKYRPFINNKIKEIHERIQESIR